MALILSLETSTTICSAALHDNGSLVASKELLTPQSASSQLAPIIDQLLKDTKISAKEIKSVAVASGPGSYTGLRIGVATAKGICYALQIPLIAINTLELMSYQVKYSHHNSSPSPLERGLGGEVNEVLLCPMLDARRMEVYCLLTDLDLNIIEPTHAKIIDEGSFINWLEKKTIYFFGNGAAKCRETIKHPNARFMEGINPSALQLGQLAFQKFTKNEFEDLSSFEPHYLKEFIIKKPKTV
jgi:tRNA threonylcarbamoyladenosine biosynthesis protein TsaB